MSVKKASPRQPFPVSSPRSDATAADASAPDSKPSKASNLVWNQARETALIETMVAATNDQNVCQTHPRELADKLNQHPAFDGVEVTEMKIRQRLAKLRRRFPTLSLPTFSRARFGHLSADALAALGIRLADQDAASA